jgi:outer membrane immunogenic protein
VKRFLLATVSMVALTSISRAADMPAKGPIYSPPSLATWDGPYVGVQGGIARQDGLLKDASAHFANADGKIGGAVGALAGYNWQHGNFVYGLEGDWNWVGAKATHFNLNGTGSSYEIDWLSTLRARAGLAVDTTLFYLTGGVALGRVNNNFALFLTNPTPLFSFAENQTRIGWSVGAGVEHLFAPQWSARAEFRYVDLGSESVACIAGSVSCANFSFSTGDLNNTLWMGLLGVSYKFGSSHTGDWSHYAPSSASVWRGGYLGVQGGVAGQSAYLDDRDAVTTGDRFDQRKTGGTIGGLLGYNWQQGSFVYGVEGDWNWVRARTSLITPNNGGTGEDLSASYAVSWLATLRGRAGLALGATLLYVTGGLAFGHVENDFDVSASVAGGHLATFAQNETKVGWAAGVGVEHMFSQHWTARAEFRYADLGATSVACSSATDFNGCVSNNDKGTFTNTLKLGLVGLAYKF